MKVYKANERQKRVIDHAVGGIKNFGRKVQTVEREENAQFVASRTQILISLEKKGLKKDAIVYNKRDGWFKITRIDVSANQFDGGSLSIAVYGNKLRKDGTFGETEHYISSYS